MPALSSGEVFSKKSAEIERQRGFSSQPGDACWCFVFNCPIRLLRLTGHSDFSRLSSYWWDRQMHQIGFLSNCTDKVWTVLPYMTCQLKQRDWQCGNSLSELRSWLKTANVNADSL